MTQDKQSFEEILESYHVTLDDNRRDESIKLAAEKYAAQFQQPISIEAISAMAEKEYGVYNYSTDERKGYMKGAKAVASALGYSAGDNWISVNEPPKESKYYYVCMVRKTDNAKSSNMAFWNGKAFVSYEGDDAEKIENKFWKITHYTSLPELPK